MKAVIYGISMIILAALQTTLLGYIEILGAKPNLMLVFAVCIALLEGPVTGGIVGLTCGIIIDVLGNGIFGFNSLTYMYIAIICGFLSINYFRSNYAVTAVFTLAGVLSYSFLYYVFMYLIWGDKNIIFVITTKILPESLYSVIAMFPIYFVLRKVKRL